MAYGNDARLALATSILRQAHPLVSSIMGATPPGFRPCSCAETLFHVWLVTAAVQLTFSSLTNPAKPECFGTVPWLLDRTIVIDAHLTCLRYPGLDRLLCASEVRQPRLPAVDGEERR